MCKNKNAHHAERVQKLQLSQQNCTHTYECAKNEIAHRLHSVQKFDDFMIFANYKLQIMKEMMISRDEITKIVKYALQIKIKEHFAKTSSFATYR